jgi:hypothetical protein
MAQAICPRLKCQDQDKIKWRGADLKGDWWDSLLQHRLCVEKRFLEDEVQFLL